MSLKKRRRGKYRGHRPGLYNGQGEEEGPPCCSGRVGLTAPEANFNVRRTRSTPATFREDPKFPVAGPVRTDVQILKTAVVNPLVLVHLALLGEEWLFELPMH